MTIAVSTIKGILRSGIIRVHIQTYEMIRHAVEANSNIHYSLLLPFSDLRRSTHHVNYQGLLLIKGLLFHRGCIITQSHCQDMSEMLSAALYRLHSMQLSDAIYRA